ncbi:hypothetical protein BXY51_001678 [Actinoplanes cyaneus]|nr:hypothetical protein [Actinoplanes cyaneus]
MPSPTRVHRRRRHGRLLRCHPGRLGRGPRRRRAVAILRSGPEIERRFGRTPVAPASRRERFRRSGPRATVGRPTGRVRPALLGSRPMLRWPPLEPGLLHEPLLRTSRHLTGLHLARLPLTRLRRTRLHVAGLLHLPRRNLALLHLAGRNLTGLHLARRNLARGNRPTLLPGRNLSPTPSRRSLPGPEPATPRRGLPFVPVPMPLRRLLWLLRLLRLRWSPTPVLLLTLAGWRLRHPGRPGRRTSRRDRPGRRTPR